jgi:ankyrin repeat protein
VPGLTALHHAAWLGHGNVVDQLLVHSAPTDGRATCGGHTPLHLACMEPACESVVKSLLRAGACEVALTDDGKTPEDLLFPCEGREGVRILLHQASARKKWGFMIVIRKLMQKEGFVRPAKLRRSSRHMDPRVMSVAEFLVDGDRAPDGVFRKVMSFIC